MKFERLRFKYWTRFEFARRLWVIMIIGKQGNVCGKTCDCRRVRPLNCVPFFVIASVMLWGRAFLGFAPSGRGVGGLRSDCIKWTCVSPRLPNCERCDRKRELHGRRSCWDFHMKMKTKRYQWFKFLRETSRVRSYIVDVKPFEDLLRVSHQGMIYRG